MTLLSDGFGDTNITMYVLYVIPPVIAVNEIAIPTPIFFIFLAAMFLNLGTDGRFALVLKLYFLYSEYLKINKPSVLSIITFMIMMGWSPQPFKTQIMDV